MPRGIRPPPNLREYSFIVLWVDKAAHKQTEAKTEPRWRRQRWSRHRLVTEISQDFPIITYDDERTRLTVTRQRNTTPSEGVDELCWCNKRWVFMVALCNRADHYIFALWFLSSSIGSRPNDHYFRSVLVCLSVCLSVCLFVCLCRVFLSRLWPDFDQTRTYVICLGLVVFPRR